MSPRRACRKDANHDEIKAIAEGLGWWIIDTYQHAQYTAGFPDQIWVCPACTVFVEIKDSHGTLTDDEEDWMMEFIAAGGCYRVVRSEEDVLVVTRELWPGRIG